MAARRVRRYRAQWRRRPSARCCCLRPDTDLTIAPRQYREARPSREGRSTPPYRITQPAADVEHSAVVCRAGVRAGSAPGRYLQVELEDGTRRNYSMANAPHENDSVQLHVRHAWRLVLRRCAEPHREGRQAAH